MKIYNQDKTEVIENPDLEKGYLKMDYITKIIPEQKEVKQVSHKEIIRVFYKDGTSSSGADIDSTKEIKGREVKEVIDVEGVPYVPEHEEKEEIQVYIPYTDAELLEIEKDQYRAWREKYFKIIDRAVWFDCLSDADKNKVRIFRLELLNITKTLEYPEVPDCVKSQIKEV